MLIDIGDHCGEGEWHTINPEFVARVSKVYKCGEYVFDIFMTCPIYQSESNYICMHYNNEEEANNARIGFITKINRKHVGV